MNIRDVDLNLLKYLDVLLLERNVTRAAEQLGITQPALSNSLRRLRSVLNDPLLIRTSSGMQPTEFATSIQPLLREMLSSAERVLQPQQIFDSSSGTQTFRIMASDYAESTLLPGLLNIVRDEAPGVVLDVLTPSDVVFTDIEMGKVDMAINRFDDAPGSFYEKPLWDDTFSCLMSRENPLSGRLDLAAYLSARHVWVSKTGMGIGVGVRPDQVQRLGWVDVSLAEQGHKRNISVFTRHYRVAALLAEQPDLLVTLPSRAANLEQSNPRLIIKPMPIDIPSFKLKMLWSALLHHNPAHRWLRHAVQRAAAASH
ncbi:MAG: LysR family transcriptional regulator [Pseudomonadales bacterium]